MLFVPRAGWEARPARQRTPLIEARLLGIALHYSAMNADEQALHKNCAGRVCAIQKFHMSKDPNDPTKPWDDIAYSHLVCKHGWVFEGRGWLIRTAANGTTAANDGFHAVCFLGDDTVGRDDVTIAGRRALMQIMLRGIELHPRATALRPHSFFKNTECPGDELRKFLSEFRAALAF